MIRILLLILCPLISVGQVYKSEKSMVTFFSDAAVEDIKAENTRSTSEINLGTGDLKFVVKNINFEFEKALMKEHFNEKYMETERFKESKFVGKLSGFDKNASGEQSVRAAGKLTIHGQTKDVDVPGTMQLINDQLTVKSKFMVKLEDYKIKIPKLLWQNIAEEVEVSIDFTYKIQ